MKWLFPLMILVAFEGLADIFAKEWSLRAAGWKAAAALACYLAANTFWLFALRSGAGLARGELIFSVSCTGLALGLGVLLYRETLSQAQWVGTALGLISIYLLIGHE